MLRGTSKGATTVPPQFRQQHGSHWWIVGPGRCRSVGVAAQRNLGRSPPRVRRWHPVRQRPGVGEADDHLTGPMPGRSLVVEEARQLVTVGLQRLASTPSAQGRFGTASSGERQKRQRFPTRAKNDLATPNSKRQFYSFQYHPFPYSRATIRMSSSIIY